MAGALPNSLGPPASSEAPGDPAEASSRGSDPPARRLKPYLALVFLGVMPLLILALFAYLISSRAVQRLVRTANDAAATITAAMAESEAEYWTASLVSHARFPTLSAAVASRNVEEVRRRLEIFVDAHPRLERAFVTDTNGDLWVDHPPAPESLNRNFSYRDWFRGVSSTAEAYVSEVYRRMALPRLSVVAVATPVRDPATGQIAGFMVAQAMLDELTELLRRVEVGEGGSVLMLDHTGTVVAHPALDVASGELNRAYAEILSALPAGTPGEAARARYEDPISGEMVLGSAVAARIGNHRWTALSQQPVAAAFAATRALAWQMAGAGLLMAGLVGGLVWGLERENGRRRRAEQALVTLNQDLERRVEERTQALRRKEEEFLQAQKMEAVGRLAGGVAHDFNNLLTVILASTELLLDKLPKEAPERDPVREAHEAAEMAAGLTGQLLAFSRKQVMQPVTLDLNEVIERMRTILDRVLGENVELVWRLSPGLHPVEFDRGQIEQVILNLAVNACDAMPDGGKLTIETANVELDEAYAAEHPDAQTGHHVMFAVTDTGTGIDDETRKRIFEPFYTTKQMGRGTGLGLSTVYGIVRQSGGNIWVYSEVGRGTTFKVYLPRAERAPTAEHKILRPTGTDGFGIVLVVEDEPGIRAMLARTLTEAGYAVLEAADGETALALARERTEPVDLLLTDVVLPDVSGPELAAELEPHAHKTLFISGYAGEALRHDGQLDEEAAFIQKPFRTRDLLAKVADVLARETPRRP